MPPPDPLPADYDDRIRRLRGRRGWSQVELAERLRTTSVTISRWENRQVKPRRAAWEGLLALEEDGRESQTASSVAKAAGAAVAADCPLDFGGRPAAVLAAAEAERLSYGHLANPFFATETSRIDPLPHQHLAVYEHMLQQPRLRFLLADDAGAGKTIMAGLYLREMLSRRRIRRVLVVPPAGLVGNWQSELRELFGLEAVVLEGADMRAADNPFASEASDLAVVSVDTLRQPRALDRLREESTAPYDLVIFDEAHKLSFHREENFRERKTGRYKLAETLAGVPGVEPEWCLPWAAQHLLLLTATPHMGKPFPYFALWRLLLPTTITTPEALEEFPRERRANHFIRRTKEEMVRLDGQPLYPERVCQTLSFALSQGPDSEQELYDETTEYLREVYNQARLLNESAARMVVSVFQRRLASSTHALACSLRRRAEKLDDLVHRFQVGRHRDDEFHAWFQKWDREQQRDAAEAAGDGFDATTADEADEATLEHAEATMGSLFVAESVTDLQDEREVVRGLVRLADRVMERGEESKFTRLREVLTDAPHADEKMLIFTEHRDTLAFLIQRLGQIGYAGHVAEIHGGMHWKERAAQLDRFRSDADVGGARIMVATDAAGEGLNMQFAGRMVNYDIPWNPARLEQRMGRIHRYGQRRDRVFVFNLVAAGEATGEGEERRHGTREGQVLGTLLKKLETIREALGNEKVFDSIGRLLSGVSIKACMDRLAESGVSADTVAAELGGAITPEQVAALAETEQRLFGDGGDVKRELPRLRESAAREAERRLMPGFVRRFVGDAAPELGLRVRGDTGHRFGFEPVERGALDWLLPILEDVGPERPGGATPLRCERPAPGAVPAEAGLWVHPGEAVFERLRERVAEKLGPHARRGALLVDPEATEPYTLHLGRSRVFRAAAGGEWPELSTEETVESRLVAIRQAPGGAVERISVQHLLCLRGGGAVEGGAPPHEAQVLMARGEALRERAGHFLAEDTRRRATEAADEARGRAVEETAWIRRGFSAEKLELAEARKLLRPKVRKGDRGAILEAERIKERQRSLDARRERALTLASMEPGLISADPHTEWIAHALVLPSRNPRDLEKLLRSSEMIAQEHAIAWLRAHGAIVREVHTQELARAAGLADRPGFDLLADFPDSSSGDTPGSGGRCHVEVKGRMGTGDVELTSNEWSRACNLGPAYWLFAVFGCATSSPRLSRVRDPFHALLTKASGTFVLESRDILAKAEAEVPIHD